MTLTEEDVEDIAAVVPNIESISIITSGDAAVDGGDLDEETTFTTAGVMPEYSQISNLSVQYGEFFTEDDEEDKAKICVLGYKTAQNIFGAAYLAQGESISIEGKNYEVVGVLSQWEQSPREFPPMKQYTYPTPQPQSTFSARTATPR